MIENLYGEARGTEPARVLTSNHPMRARNWLDLDGPAAERMDVSFTGLLDSVRTGEIAYPKIFGRPVWEDLEDSPKLATSFGELMASRAASFAPDVVKCYNWNDLTHVIDVGGGAGLLLKELLHAHPAMTGTLVGLPAMAALAETTFEAARLTHRTSALEGNIFNPLPADGDLYLLASILHDWNDHDATRILRRRAQAAGTGGRILVVDRTSNHGNSLTFTFMNLLMLVFLGGRTPSGLSLLSFVVE